MNKVAQKTLLFQATSVIFVMLIEFYYWIPGFAGGFYEFSSVCLSVRPSVTRFSQVWPTIFFIFRMQLGFSKHKTEQ